MTDRSRPLLAVQALIASLLILTGLGTASAAAEKRIQFNIVAQDLASALNEFARQSAQELLFSTDLAASKRTSGIVGEFAPTDALKALLQGTGLRYRINNDNTILIERSDLESARHNGLLSSPFMTPMMGSQAMPAFRAAQDPQGDAQDSSAAASSDDSAARLGEMTVTTGSHIPGADTGSPVLVFDREAIEKTGAATAEQFLATLPQNFSSGRTADSVGEVPGTQNDDVYGSAANLRGLGAGSTLVLIDGRRSAPSGSTEYVDISMIPLSAVERIEVLTDGASAIYGADAIGGVVNFIMRKEYSGGETRLRSGWTSDGGGKERQASQTLGATWSTGRALLSYEYYDRDPITYSQREFTQEIEDTVGNFPLIAAQEKHGAFFSAEQSIGDAFSISANALYGERRSSDPRLELGSDLPNTITSQNVQSSGALTFGYRLANTWQAELTGGVSRNELDSHVEIGVFPDANSTHTYEAEVRSVDLRLTGDLFQLPSGTVALAVGSGYREESTSGEVAIPAFDLTFPLTAADFDVTSAFAELQIPLIAGKDAGGPARLSFSIAGRYEDYSHFGDTFDPKFGVVFAPLESLRLRASYGTSFKPPTLYQLDSQSNTVFIFDIPTSTGTARILTEQGNNFGLGPETATTFTAGVDYMPERGRGFRAHFTYFEIDYEDRIESVDAPQIAQLTDPGYAGTRVARGEVSDAEFDAAAADILANANGLLIFGCLDQPPSPDPCLEPPSNLDAILDRRLLNLATSQDSGVDLTLVQRLEGTAGTFEYGLSMTYLFDFERQFTSAAPAVELVDTLYFPTDFRARGTLSWQRGGLDSTLFINFTDSYEDNGISPSTEVRSWTTLDLNISYDTHDRLQSLWLDDMVVALNVTNLFDKDPPFANQFSNIGYDPANADPYGRIISVSVNKAW